MSAPEEDWIVLLREECEARGQKAVGKLIGYSPGAISAVLKGSYTASLDHFKSAVEGALMGATVECPILGELPRNKCLGHQRRKFAATNPTRVALANACPQCPNRINANAARGGKENP